MGRDRDASRAGPWLVAALVLVGLDLRTVFASLPPLLDDVRDDLGLSATTAGLLTTGPVLCFGVFALAAPASARRLTLERLVAAMVALTAAGAGLRGVGGTAGLFAGTLLAGTAVAVGQTAVPMLIRLRFARRAGPLTGTFSMALTVGAAAAAGSAVPLSNLLGGWEPALSVFAVPAAVAAALWAVVAGGGTHVGPHRSIGVRRSRGAWSLAVFFGVQSMAFYAGLTWLPTILESDGYSPAAAGGLQALAAALQFGPAFFVPVLAGRRRQQTGLLAVVVAVPAAGLTGLLLAPGAAVLWMVLVGLGQGSALGLALILPVLRAGDRHAIASLTAMALSVGYLIAAGGPWLLGLAHDVTGGWRTPLALLIGITLAEFVVGVPATRAWRIGAAGSAQGADVV